MKGKRHSGITIIFLVEIICNAWLSRVRVQCLMSFFLLSNGCRSSRKFGEFKDTSNYLIPLRHLYFFASKMPISYLLYE